jgi:hypothetical protein
MNNPYIFEWAIKKKANQDSIDILLPSIISISKTTTVVSNFGILALLKKVTLITSFYAFEHCILDMLFSFQETIETVEVNRCEFGSQTTIGATTTLASVDPVKQIRLDFNQDRYNGDHGNGKNVNLSKLKKLSLGDFWDDMPWEDFGGANLLDIIFPEPNFFQTCTQLTYLSIMDSTNELYFDPDLYKWTGPPTLQILQLFGTSALLFDVEALKYMKRFVKLTLGLRSYFLALRLPRSNKVYCPVSGSWVWEMPSLKSMALDGYQALKFKMGFFGRLSTSGMV